MRARTLAGAAALLAALWAAGCGSALSAAAGKTASAVKDMVHPSNLDVHAVRSIRLVTVGRVAVMPLLANPGASGAVVAEGGPDAVTAELYSQAVTEGGWDLVPPDDVARAMRKLPPDTARNLDQNALKLGRDLSADGVLYGTVQRYREREGLEYAAAAPAAVAFTLRFLDLKSGQVVWTGKFAKEQKALAQNVFDLFNFVQHKGRWVRAHEIAQEGVQAAVADLHGRLNFAPSAKRFAAGANGALKPGPPP